MCRGSLVRRAHSRFRFGTKSSKSVADVDYLRAASHRRALWKRTSKVRAGARQTMAAASAIEARPSTIQQRN